MLYSVIKSQRASERCHTVLPGMVGLSHLPERIEELSTSSSLLYVNIQEFGVGVVQNRVNLSMLILLSPIW